MTDLIITGELAAQIRAAAAQNDLEPDEVLQQFMESFPLTLTKPIASIQKKNIRIDALFSRKRYELSERIRTIAETYGWNFDEIRQQLLGSFPAPNPTAPDTSEPALRLWMERREIADSIRSMAELHNASEDEFLQRLVNRSIHIPVKRDMSERGVELRMYDRARLAWFEMGDQLKAAMTDDELDEQFWFIDEEGVPHLKSEDGTIEVPHDPLVDMLFTPEWQAAGSGRSDISQNVSKNVSTLIYQNHLDRQTREE